MQYRARFSVQRAGLITSPITAAFAIFVPLRSCPPCEMCVPKAYVTSVTARGYVEQRCKHWSIGATLGSPCSYTDMLQQPHYVALALCALVSQCIASG